MLTVSITSLVPLMSCLPNSAIDTPTDASGAADVDDDDTDVDMLAVFEEPSAAAVGVEEPCRNA